MPTPNPNESQNKFIGRCVPYVQKEHPEWEQKKCVAVCYSLWKNRKKSVDILKGIQDDILDIKSIIENKVTTPPLKNIRDVKLPKDKKKPWYK